MSRCPTCDSPAPHLHPAVQHDGEVGLCTDNFHLRQTNRNKAEYIAAVLAAQMQKYPPLAQGQNNGAD